MSLEKATDTVLFDSPTRRVGGDVVESFKKHNHKSKLYSLDKAVSEEELFAFETRLKKYTTEDIDYTVEYKFDGLTICLTYDNGEFVRGTTRGNGTVGEDVTAQVLTIKTYPLKIKNNGLVEVQGEAIMKLSSLEEYNKTAKEPLKNARNAVAGAIRNLDPKITAKRKLEIYFYNVNYLQDGTINSQQECVSFLKENGFKVHDFLNVCHSMQEVILSIEKIKKERSSLDILTDGAVVKVNNYAIREDASNTEKFPRWAIAFKFEAEEVTTIVKKVVFQVGRTGKVTPLAIVKSVELAGATVKKATLNNFNDIKRKDVKINSRVLIRRSNEVIPEILGATEHFENSKEIIKPEICPYCESKLVEIGANLFCTNKDCKPRVVASLAHFAKKDAMNIDGFSEKTAEMLFDKLAIDSFYQLYELKKEQLESLDKFKDKKTKNLLQAIEKSKNVSFANFIYALSIDGVGAKTAKDIAKKFPSIEQLFATTEEELLQIDEVGEVIACNICEYVNNQENKQQLQKLLQLGININYDSIVKSGVLLGEKVVITGSFEGVKRDELSKIVFENGGEVLSSVTKATTLLIAGEKAGSKLDKAKGLNIKIISLEEFKSLL